MDLAECGRKPGCLDAHLRNDFAEKLACELLLMQQTMEVMLHSLGVREYEDLGGLRLPFAVAARLGTDSCRFVALSPDLNARGLGPCVLKVCVYVCCWLLVPK